VSLFDPSQEHWTPRSFPAETLFAPGQKFGPTRYDERFAAAEADVDAGFRGVTTDGAVVPGLYQLASTGLSLDRVRQALRALVNALTPAQRAQVQMPVDARDVRLWHGLFTRRLRHGVALEEMTDLQRWRVEDVIESSFSPRGSRVVADIRRTSDLIGQVTGLFVDFGRDVYWLSVLGDLSGSEPWGWQLDGHHVNVTFVVVGDQVVMTPTFLGAEPTIIESGPYAGIHLFQEEQSDGAGVFAALSSQQRETAIIASELTPEVFAGPFRDNLELGYAGISATEFDETQLATLRRLIVTYTGYLPSGHSGLRYEEVLAHLDDTFFAWIGGMEGTPPFYYRVQSPVVLIEFEHIFGVGLEGDDHSANHVHTAVRTPNGNDYGLDLIRQHRERAHDPDVGAGRGEKGDL